MHDNYIDYTKTELIKTLQHFLKEHLAVFNYCMNTNRLADMLHPVILRLWYLGIDRNYSTEAKIVWSAYHDLINVGHFIFKIERK